MLARAPRWRCILDQPAENAGAGEVPVLLGHTVQRHPAPNLVGGTPNGAIADGERPSHGSLVAPNVYGPNPEVEARADPPWPGNPSGNAWRVVETPLRAEG